jgi:hypothetical protein
MSGERKPRTENGWVARSATGGHVAAHTCNSAQANALINALQRLAERLWGRCPVVAHKSLTPFSNENGVTLMAIAYREYQVAPD